MATMTAERVRTMLDERGVPYEMMDHPLAYTAQEVAAAEHISGDSFAKATLLMADGQLVMAVLPAPLKVDLEKARRVFDATEVRLATETEFQPTFPDSELGAEPPFGHLYSLPVYLDQRLTADTITFNAGSHRQTMSISLSDYLDLEQPVRADLARA